MKSPHKKGKAAERSAKKECTTKPLLKPGRKGSGKFTIDFFELLLLAEACIPPGSISRVMFFQNMSDVYYKHMTDTERYKAFNWIVKNAFFKLDDEDCQVFFDRFNPCNQYKITTSYEGKVETQHCFKHKGRYHTSKITSVIEEYITNVEKIGVANV